MLSHIVQEVVTRYKRTADEETPESIPRIHIDEVASQVSVFYEKLRNVVDYKEEHLIRRRFIDRVLHRRLFLNKGDKSAESIVKEIIRAGYLPNDAIPETKIAEVALIIRNYEYFEEHVPMSKNRANQKEFSEWLFIMTASAIEENLFPPRKENALVDIMFLIMKEHLVIRGEEPSDEKKDLQLFVAVRRALLKADEDQLHYQLLKSTYPKWGHMTDEECEVVAGTLRVTRKKMKSIINDPLGIHFLRTTTRYSMVFHLIGDLIDRAGSFEDFSTMISDIDRMESEMREAYDNRFRVIRKRLNRIGFLSVLSFFLSKILIVLAIEIPIEQQLTHSFSLENTVVNILFPPLLMLIIALSIKMPKAGNFHLVFEASQQALFEEENTSYVIEIPKKRGFLGEALLNLFYLATFVVVFYLASKLLIPLSFTTANIIVLLLFVSVVAAAGVRMHNRAKELSLDKPHTNIISFLFDLFSMPFVSVGKWIIDGLAKFNPIVVLINLLIELPFQLFVEFVENFNRFLRNKKEEIT
ncbi:MAG: hypothetical protein UW92_C0003G0036 [Candidatus Jorgensenbacteria bacterium GW2011_GWA2_45_13]|uniref:Uncharacterized protein n=1 Tax=Candidatus Jorgensenbacteria bacterium GW2011_GWA2_45_13 TaxID=1618662 RepID=A0A0G1P7G4_9BACT|nr:MAG: hypothetical protein UW92_C0003G0036 [Candidatus Jorgensenbacteria bacterium GW2011_GWA2_45_13]